MKKIQKKRLLIGVVIAVIRTPWAGAPRRGVSRVG